MRTKTTIAILTCIFLLTVLALAPSLQHVYNKVLDNFAAKEVVMTTSYANQSAWVMRQGNGIWAVKEVVATDIMNAVPGSLVVTYPTDNLFGTTMAEMKGYFVSIASREVAFRLDCGFNLGGLTVGYFDRVDLAFIRALMEGYRMDANAVTLVELSYKDVTKLSKRLDPFAVIDGHIDLVIAYLIPKSPFHRLLQSQNISVMGFASLDIERVRVFQPSINLENVKLKSLFFDIGSTAAGVMARENDTKLPSLMSRVVRIKAPPSPKSVLDSFITRLDIDPKTTDASYRCYGDPNTDIRALCDSEYDVIGAPKRSPTVWDQPCTTNDDCHFYDSSQNRGGCDKKDGNCELPVAVKRLSYRTYDDKGVNAPFKRDGKYIFANRNG